ncbi:MAG: hypothetical protein ACJ77K_14960 [Bacteroidia bacterium]
MIFALLISLQLIVNLVFDLSGVSKKYFSSSGAFIFFCFVILWELAAFYISVAEPDIDSEIIPFLGFIVSFAWRMAFLPIVPLIVQLFYSYLLRRVILRDRDQR